MVSGFFLPKFYSKQLKKKNKYELYLMNNHWPILKVKPIGMIWYQQQKKGWANTLHVDNGYFEIKRNGSSIGIAYVENRIVLKIHWNR